MLFSKRIWTKVRRLLVWVQAGEIGPPMPQPDMEREQGYTRRVHHRLDISKYADHRSDDTIPHEKLREILGQRLSDGVIAD
jgi:hypothetical protein